MVTISNILGILSGIVFGWGVSVRFLRGGLDKEAKQIRAQVEEEKHTLESIMGKNNLEIRKKYETVEGEAKQLQDMLEGEMKKRAEAEKINERVQEFEMLIEFGYAAIVDLETENIGLKEEMKSLETKIEAERRSFEEGIVFVKANHYIPGRVIQNLTRKTDITDEDNAQKE